MPILLLKLSQIYKVPTEATEIAHSVKCSLCNYEDLASDPQKSLESQTQLYTSVTSALGR